MEYEALQAFVGVLLAGCAAIVCISGMVAAVVRFWKWAHKDTDKNTEDIGEFRRWLASDKHRIEDLEEKQDQLDRMNKLQLKALFTLLGHEIDGNHTVQLEEVRKEINNYLIEK